MISPFRVFEWLFNRFIATFLEFQTNKPSGARTQSPTIDVVNHQHSYQQQYNPFLEFRFSYTHRLYIQLFDYHQLKTSLSQFLNFIHALYERH